MKSNSSVSLYLRSDSVPGSDGETAGAVLLLVVVVVTVAVVVVVVVEGDSEEGF